MISLGILNDGRGIGGDIVNAFVKVTITRGQVPVGAKRKPQPDTDTKGALVKGRFALEIGFGAKQINTGGELASEESRFGKAEIKGLAVFSIGEACLYGLSTPAKVTLGQRDVTHEIVDR